MSAWRTVPVAALACLVALGVGGCAGGEGGGDVGSDDVAGAADEAAADGPRQIDMFGPGFGLAGEFTGDFDAIVERGFVRALVTYSRTHYFLDGATQRGLAYEGLRGFETYLNAELGRKVRKLQVVIIPVHRDELLPALEHGLGDLAAANLTVTPGREERVDFAVPFADDVRELVVTGPSGPDITGVDDLAGAEIHVRRSSSFWASLERVSRELEARGLEPVDLVPAEEFLETEDLLELVNAGVLPATVADDHVARFWSTVYDDLVVHDDVAIREGGSIAWAVRKSAPGLKEKLDAFARKHRRGTLTTNVLLNRYLRDNQWVRNPLAGDDRRRFEEVVELFRRYGGKYDFDHLLLTALAYQESRLDHSVRSRAGAVGIMQIKPATAAEMGVENIEVLENNIHAGAKYLDYLRDRYFSDGDIPPFDQVLLTFAAYNAGPARVRQLRSEAAEAGLDPNRWFGNVELIAARRVGRETVQYVSNIAKYYVAYTQAARVAETRDAERPAA